MRGVLHYPRKGSLFGKLTKHPTDKSKRKQNEPFGFKKGGVELKLPAATRSFYQTDRQKKKKKPNPKLKETGSPWTLGDIETN